MGVNEINSLDFNEINIDDKGLFDRYLKLHNPQASELTFTNFFMWRYFYKFRFAEVADLLCIIAAPEKKEPYAFMPLGIADRERLGEAVARLKEYFSRKGWTLRFGRVTEEECAGLRPFLSSEEDMVFDRNNSDYIYLSEDLIQLKGKRFDGKRNHINKFKKLYSYEYIPLTEEFIDDCARIMNEWCAERDCDEHREFYCEKIANMELLKNFEKLRCKGALIKVDGRFEAFTVGEMLNSNTAVIHIEKASSSINGLYTFINQQFCEHEWNSALYINREQDLGIEGLRKAKLSYNPEKMIQKYNIRIP